jgi:hypothetical protein
VKYKVTKPLLSWPDKCAACCGSADATVTAKCQVAKSVIPLPGFAVVNSRVLRVSYPVCKKHKITALILGKLSQRNLLNLALGVVSVFLLIKLFTRCYQYINGIPIDPDSVPIGYFIVLPALYWGAFYVAKKFTPVKISDFRNDGITFEFGNNEYLELFKSKNPE